MDADRWRPTSLWGRDAELARLRAFLGSVRKGVGGCVVIEGDAGFGKSRLLREALFVADPMGFETYVGEADALERDRPFAAVAHALNPHRSSLPDVMWGAPSGGAGEVSTTEFAIAERIVDLLEQRSQHCPVLLALEDLHWADEATLLFVRTAARRLRELPFGLVLTLRPSEVSPPLGHLIDRLRGAGTETVGIGPLDAVSMGGLLMEVLGAMPGPVLLAQIERTGGCPFYLLELVNALDADGLIKRTDGTAELDRPLMPPSLRSTILRRLSSLPPATLRDLNLAAVLGQAFRVDDLAVVADAADAGLLATLEPALRSGVLRDQGDQLAFGHDLLWTAIYEGIPMGLRRRMHLSIGSALAAAGRPSIVVAGHMAAGAEVGDSEAVDWLCRAADDVGTASLSTTAHLLQRAGELCDLDDPQRHELAARRVEALAFTPRAAEAAEVARDLLAQPLAPDVELRSRIALAVALETLGHPGEARIELDCAVSNNTVPPQAVPGLVTWRAWMDFQAGEVTSARRDVAIARADAERMQEPYALMASAALLAHISNADGYVAEAVAYGLEASTRAADVSHSRQWSLAVTANVATLAELAAAATLIAGDRIVEGTQHLDAGRRAAETQQSRGVVLLQMALAAAKYFEGAWDDALVEAETGLALAEDMRQAVLVGLGIAARIRTHRGELDHARTFVERGMRDLEENGPSFGTDILLWANALLVEAESSSDGALAILEGLWSILSGFRYVFGTWRFIWPDLARLAMQAGRLDLASAVRDAAEEGARRAGGIPSAEGAALRIRAVVEGDVDLALASVDAYRRSPRRAELAAACEDAGYVLRDAGDRRSTTYLEEASDLLWAMGALRDADRVRSSLRSLGKRQGVRGPRRRPTHGWDALTATELRVIEQVVLGLTNARIGEHLFISARTVQSHLRNIFNKLGVSSRTELAGLASRQRS